MVVGVSRAQMIPLQKKIWELAPPGEVDPGNAFRPGFGITGNPPRVVFVDGPGKGSVIHIATYKQGSQRIAGATLHFVVMDEPPPEAMYAEIVPRVKHHRGQIRIGMTPTPDMPDQSWLRELVDAGQISEHNFGISADACWPEGALFPWTTPEEVATFEASLIEEQREMRMRGAWDPVVTGRWLSSFLPSANVSAERPPESAFYGLGIDHGTAVGKQAAVLIGVAARHSERPRVWYMGEYTTDEASTPEDDALGILEMLEACEVPFDAVDLIVGDIDARSKRDDATKSNKLVRRELARALERPTRDVQYIAPVKKFAGSVAYGLRLMNTLFARRDDDGRPSALIHPRCAKLIRAAQQFAGDSHDPLKDVLDAGRYITEMSLRQTRRPGFRTARGRLGRRR